MSANKGQAFAAPVIAALILCGCATVKPVPPRDLLSITGRGAAAYIALPVKANRSLADRIVSGIFGTKLNAATLDRVDAVYAAVYADSGIQAVVTGSIPAAAASAVFPAASGWVRKEDAGGSAWFSSATAEGAIPENGMLFYAAGSAHVAPMLSNRITPVPVETAPKFAAWLDSPDALQAIGIYIPNPATIAGKILGPAMDMPFGEAVVYVSPYDDSDAKAEGRLYTVSARITMRDARAGRAVMTMLRLATRDSIGAVIRLDGSDVCLEGFRVSEEKLAGMIGLVVF